MNQHKNVFLVLLKHIGHITNMYILHLNWLILFPNLLYEKLLNLTNVKFYMNFITCKSI